MPASRMIPRIDVSALFSGTAAGRAAVDAAIMAAAAGDGFMTIHGLPADLPSDPDHRRALLRLFDLPPAVTRALWRQKFDPAHRNVYRGWFPLQNGAETYKEGIDIGPDIARGDAALELSDPLREATPLPPEHALPGWRAAAAASFQAMEQIGQSLMRAIARGLNLSENSFDDIFRAGISTLRLIRYPVRPPKSMAGIPDEKLWLTQDGRRRYMLGRAHVDSGFVTLLAQDGISGLQARRASGGWIDVEPQDDALVVNFGSCWNGGPAVEFGRRNIGCWAMAKSATPSHSSTNRWSMP